MGVSNSKRNSKIVPSCAINFGKYKIETKTGLISSKSPSDLFMISLSSSKEKYFVKLWVNSRVLPKLNRKQIEQKSLEYEGAIYNKLNNLEKQNKNNIFEGVSASILPVKHYYNNISFDELKSILTDGMNYHPKEVENRLLRNTLFMMGQYERRFKITEQFSISHKSCDLFNMITKNKNKLRYGMIITKYISNKDFSDFLVDCRKEGGKLRKWAGIFKVLEKIKQINDKGIFHQDLWLGNILWNREDGVDKFYIYDFDRAYDKELGDNPMLKTNTREGKIRAERQGQYNRVNENSSKDMVKFLCHITEDFYTTEGYLEFSKLVFEKDNIFDESEFKSIMVYHGVFRDDKGEFIPLKVNIRDCLIPKILYTNCVYLSRSEILKKVLLELENIRELGKRINVIKGINKVL